MNAITMNEVEIPLSALSSPSSLFNWQPVYLSCIAGASTCIGAAVVFFQPRSKDNRNIRIVPPGTMAFSLALAGSVMLTVSLVSILPECWKDDGVVVDAVVAAAGRGGDGGANSGQIWGMIPLVWSDWMVYRIMFFMLGALLYFGLSWSLNIPEPQDLLQQQGWNMNVMNRNRTTSPRMSTTTKTSLGSTTGSCSSSTAAARPIMDQNVPPDIEKEDREDKHLDSSMILSLPSEESQGPAEYSTDNHSSYQDKKSSPRSRWRKTKSRLAVDNDTIMIPPPLPLPASLENCDGKEKSKHRFFKWTTWTTGKDLQSKEQQKAWRVAMLLFFSLLVHNFPEGLAVAASALESTNLGVTVTIGIMIHNIPEGIAIAIPCLAARPDQPWLSFVLASISGLAEPLGAFVALLLLSGLDKTTSTIANGAAVDGGGALLSLENVLAFVAGIMVTVALWELFPEAKRHSINDKKTHFWCGTVTGVVVMVLTEMYLP